MQPLPPPARSGAGAAHMLPNGLDGAGCLD